MYTILFAIGVALVTVFLPMAVGIGAQWTIVPGLILGVITFVLIGRRIGRRVQAVTQAADAELATLQKVAQRPGPQTQAIIRKKFDNAVTLLQRGFLFEKWQFGVGTMLNARIGMLLFSRTMVDKDARVGPAIPYLEKARIKGRKAKLLKALWPAWAMLGVAYYKTDKKNLDRVKAVFEGALKAEKTDGLLYSIYAWILWKSDRTDAALEVMVRAKDALPSDERVGENLTALQNGKSMKMRAYGEGWYQFGLEKPKAAQMQQPRMSHPRARRARGR